MYQDMVVKVTITARKAYYAFTAIVGAFNSGNLTADATAGLQSGTCKLPPLVIKWFTVTPPKSLPKANPAAAP